MNNSSEVRPASIPLSLPTTAREWTKMAACLQGAVVLERAASTYRVGPLIGRYDIYVSADAYMFRMSLPGVDVNKNSFGLEVKTTGEVTIKGETYRGKIYDLFSPEELHIVVNMLPEAGPFSITFKLPGPVRNETLSAYSADDGFYWGIVYKQFGDTNGGRSELS